MAYIACESDGQPREPPPPTKVQAIWCFIHYELRFIFLLCSMSLDVIEGAFDSALCILDSKVHFLIYCLMFCLLLSKVFAFSAIWIDFGVRF